MLEHATQRLRDMHKSTKANALTVLVLHEDAKPCECRKYMRMVSQIACCPVRTGCWRRTNPEGKNRNGQLDESMELFDVAKSVVAFDATASGATVWASESVQIQLQCGRFRETLRSSHVMKQHSGSLTEGSQLMGGHRFRW